MSATPKLVYLKRTSYQLEAYFADLSTEKTDLSEILFRGPISIAAVNPYPADTYFDCAIPLFDDKKKEIVWVAHGEEEEDPVLKGGTVDIWRIRSHFALQSFERMPLNSDFWRPPSFILDSGSLSIGDGMPSQDSDLMSTIVQRQEDGEWTALAVNTMPKPTRFNNGRAQYMLFQGLESSMEYIYILRKPMVTVDNLVFIDLIKASRFRESTSNNSIVWQNFEIDIGFSSDITPIAQLITTDRSTGKHRLYFLRLDASNRCINIAYVWLRKDGSIDSYQRKFKAEGQQRLPMKVNNHFRGLKATGVGDRKVLLSWEDGENPIGMIGAIAKNGAIPEAAGWKNIEIKFETALKINGRDPPFAAVVVPSDFAD